MVGRFCPNCGQPTQPGAKFCANCGQSLVQATPTEVERHSRLNAAAPQPLAQKMRAAKTGGERKPVTSLFADIVGSTSIVEHMDPEDWTAVVDQAFERMTAAIYQYEGTVARLMGDAILAFFGAPVAHEDDPERAIRAGLDMIKAIDDLSPDVRREHGFDLRIRVGLNTGPVLVGTVGTDLMYEYTAMGDAVNVAARMQSAARPGTVLITQQTYRPVAALFDVTPLEPLTVKGKTEPIQAYEVIAPKAAPGRTRGLAGLESPMVGRQAELTRLVELFDAAAAGRARTACVVAEPGIGKSRLLAELKLKALERSDVTWVEGRCLSYGQKLAYHLLLDVLRSFIGVPSTATPRNVWDALDAKVSDLLGDDARDVTPYLGHLMSLPLPPEANAQVRDVDALILQGLYQSAMRRLVGAASRRGPVVLVCEDVHWADSSSVDILAQVVPLMRSERVLVVVATRPDRESPGWRLVTSAERVFGDAFAELQLRPLSDAESRTLVSNLLEIESLPANVRDHILARAEGNPFFVEEVIRTLIDRGAIVREGPRWIATSAIGQIEIPENLQGLLLARIDRLPQDAKRAIQVASVVGRQFPVRVVESVIEVVG